MAAFSTAQIHGRLLAFHPIYLYGRNCFNLSPPLRCISYRTRRCLDSRLSVSMCIEGSHKETSPSETAITTPFSDDAHNHQVVESVQSYTTSEEVNGKLELEVSAAGVQQKGAAKIHDFCFGIPFGGIVVGGGLVSFLFTRNPASLSGVLYGVALLLLSGSSLKTWRQGKSSFPHILGQAALAAALLWKHLQIYTLTKKLFPTGFFAVLSAAMLSFYTYVMASGGNPPPKKLKSTASS